MRNLIASEIIILHEEIMRKLGFIQTTFLTLTGIALFVAAHIAWAAKINKKLNGELLPGDTITNYTVSPDGRFVVYSPIREEAVYSVLADGSQPPVKLTGLLPQGGRIYAYQISPDSQSVIYTADQDVFDEIELYIVPITGGPAVKLNDTLVAGGNVISFDITPDGETVVYRADQNVDEKFALFAVDVGTQVVERLNESLPFLGDVYSFKINALGSHVVYRASQNSSDVIELFSVSLRTGSVVQLNQPLVTDGDVFGIDITPDGKTVVYRADAVVDLQTELFSVPIQGGIPLKLNPSIALDGSISNFQISPDGQWVVYRGQQNSLLYQDLFAVSPNGGSSIRLNNTLDPNSGIDLSSDFYISPDSQRVVYFADELDAAVDIQEMFSVPISGGVPVKLNGSFVTGGSISEDYAQITVDSQAVIFPGDYETNGTYELFMVPITGGPITKLNDEIGPNEDIAEWFNLQPDGSGVAYNAWRTDGNELMFYSFESENSTLLSGPFSAPGGMISVLVSFSPDGSKIFYLADQEVPGQFELYTTYDNERPVFTSSPVTQAKAGENYRYDIVGEDSDLQGVTIQTRNLPSWLSLIDNGDGTALLRGRPTAQDTGLHQIELRIRDSDLLASIQRFEIEVLPENLSPIFESRPDQTLTVGIEYRYEVIASDPDSTQPVVFESDVPGWLNFADQGDGSALLAGLPTAAEIGTHEVRIRAKDGDGGTAEQIFTLTVSAPNSVPRITTTPVTLAQQGEPYRYEIEAEDADLGPSLTFTTSFKPDWLTFQDNGDGTAVLAGTPTANDVGSEKVRILVNDDQGGMDSQVYVLTVLPADGGPAFTSLPLLNGTVNESYTYMITAEDPSGTGLTFETLTKPAWLTLQDNGDGTALLSGIPTPADVGNVTVMLQVTDGNGRSDMQSFSIAVAGEGVVVPTATPTVVPTITPTTTPPTTPTVAPGITPIPTVTPTPGPPAQAERLIFLPFIGR